MFILKEIHNTPFLSWEYVTYSSQYLDFFNYHEILRKFGWLIQKFFLTSKY